MALTEFARKELNAAGLFDPGSDYEGLVGQSVLQLVQVFAAQGHSGMSAELTVYLFGQLGRFKPIMKLKNPTLTKEYIEHDDSNCLQSTRVSSVFSADGGRTWYDLDKAVPWWQRIRGVRRAYIRFDDHGIAID